jgi:plasmid maintenance system antidote protein VapI
LAEKLHPGEILREEYLVPLGMSVHALSLALRGLPAAA